MKKANALLVFLFMFLSSTAFYAQDLDSKGFTVQTYIGMYMQDGELMSYDVNEVYNVSLKDGYLIHNILKDNIVSDSQMYKITNIKKGKTDGETKFSFDATSGISGKKYFYEIFFDPEGTVTLNLTQPDGSVTVFLATSAIFKTFNQ